MTISRQEGTGLHAIPTSILQANLDFFARTLPAQEQNIKELEALLERQRAQLAADIARRNHAEAVIAWRERMGRTNGDVFTDMNTIATHITTRPNGVWWWLLEFETQRVGEETHAIFFFGSEASDQQVRVVFELVGDFHGNGKDLDLAQGCRISAIERGERDYEYSIVIPANESGDHMLITLEGYPLLVEILPAPEAA